MGNKELNKYQIFKASAANTFVEVLVSMFDRGKVILNFIQYGGEDNKKTKEIPIYMDIPEFMVFSKNVSYNMLQKQIDAEKAATLGRGQNAYPNAVWKTAPAGTSKEKLAQYGRSRSDGRDEARLLQIKPATKAGTADLVLEAVKGPGKCMEDGKIIPDFNFKDGHTVQIYVPMSYDKLRGLCEVTYGHIIAYFTSQWVSGMYRPSEGKELTSTEEKEVQQTDVQQAEAGVYTITYKTDFHPMGNSGHVATVTVDSVEYPFIVWDTNAEPFRAIFGEDWSKVAYSGKSGAVKAVIKDYKGHKQLVFDGFVNE